MFDDFYDKLKEYYQMKHEYEEEFKINKNKILKLTNINLLEKYNKINSIKPKCINCKRPVGTVFDIIQIENILGKTVSAKCGDKLNPCPLKIELYMGYIKSLPVLINDEISILDNYKKDIINLKNKLVIGAITENDVIEYFKDLKEKINISHKLLESYNEQYSKITENSDIIDKIKMNSITYNTLLHEISTLLNDFYKTNNDKLIHDAIEIYINDFIPLINMQLKNKYEDCSVSLIPTKNMQSTYFLIQNKTKPESLECVIIEPRVISFIKGISLENSNKLSISNSSKKIKNKTKKIKPTPN